MLPAIRPNHYTDFIVTHARTLSVNGKDLAKFVVPSCWTAYGDPLTNADPSPMRMTSSPHLEN